MQRSLTHRIHLNAHHDVFPLATVLPFSFVLALVVVVTSSTACVWIPLPQPTASASKSCVLVETRIDSADVDTNSHRLRFAVNVLSNQRSWRFSSSEDLQTDQPLLNPELIAQPNRAQDVFCIGTASSEGERGPEEDRAARRASTLEHRVARVIQSPGQTRVFRLNAGQYVGHFQVSSDDQRKAVITVAHGHDDDVDLAGALPSGLIQAAMLPPSVFCTSTCDPVPGSIHSGGNRGRANGQRMRFSVVAQIDPLRAVSPLRSVNPVRSAGKEILSTESWRPDCPRNDL
jgi:hypothetical protein